MRDISTRCRSRSERVGSTLQRISVSVDKGDYSASGCGLANSYFFSFVKCEYLVGTFATIWALLTATSSISGEPEDV